MAEWADSDLRDAFLAAHRRADEDGLRADIEALARELDVRDKQAGEYGVAFSDGHQHAAAELRAVLARHADEPGAQEAGQ